MALSLATESWTWYSIVILVVFFRFTSRVIHLGSWKRLQVEDLLMLFITCIYTVLVVFMQIVATADTNLMLPEEIPTLTPESIQSRIYGSKFVLLVEQCMITTQWGCKICVLLIYHKLTMGLKQRWAVKIVAVYVVLGWLVMEILYFGIWCQPFDQYWAVPVSNEQCSTALHHLIVNAVFNISSDLMMLCIPLPLLLTLKLPPLKKAVLCGLFGLGIFVILCAALNKYYSFTEPFSAIWTFWYIREASTAVLVANIPNCWPLLRRIFDLRSFFSSSTSSRDPALTTRGLAAVSYDANRPVAETESLEHINTARSERLPPREPPLAIWRDLEICIHSSDSDTDPELSHDHDHGHGIAGDDMDLGVKNDRCDPVFRTRTVVTAQRPRG